MVRTFQPERYTGYLKPWLGDIVQLYATGHQPRDIAERIQPAVNQYKLGPYRYCVTDNMILYVLRRTGVYRAPRKPLTGREAERRLRQRAKLLSWFARPDFTILDDIALSKGRPLDMGGPRDIWLEQSPWDER